MAHQQFSNFLATLFNIPNESSADIRGVNEEENNAEMYDDDNEEVIGETMNDLEVEMLSIMQEMSAAQVQTKENKCVSHPKVKVVEQLQADIGENTRRSRTEKRKIIMTCEVRLVMRNQTQLVKLARENGAYIRTKDAIGKETSDRYEEEKKTTRKCEVRLVRRNIEQLARLSVENSAEFLTAYSDSNEVSDKEPCDWEEISVQNVLVNEVSESHKKEENHKILNKCEVRVVRWNLDELARLAVENGVKILTSDADKGMSENNVPDKDTPKIKKPDLKNLVRVAGFETFDREDATRVIKVLGEAIGYGISRVEEEDSSTVGYLSEETKCDGLMTSKDVLCQSISNEGGSVSTVPVKQGMYVSCDEGSMVTDCVSMSNENKENINEGTNKNDKKEFEDFLEVCKRKEKCEIVDLVIDYDDDNEDAAVTKSKNTVKKRKDILKVGNKLSAATHSVKSMLKTVVNKLGLLKTTKYKIPQGKSLGFKRSENPKGQRNEKHVNKSHVNVISFDNQSRSASTKMKSQKEKMIKDPIPVYADKLLTTFFNPVQPAKESSPLFRIPKLVRPEPRQELTRPSSAASKYNDRYQMVRSGGQTVTLGTFLRKEGIEVNTDFEHFMMEADMLEIDKYTRPDTVNLMLEEGEISDIYHKDWETLRGISSDKDRKMYASAAFENTVPANPSRNLTFHGYRSSTQVEKVKDGSRPNPTKGSFVINVGVLEPITGNKRKFELSQECEWGVKKRKIWYEDFGRAMKSKMMNKYLEGGRLSQQKFEQFKDFLSHYKAGQEETENFLAFYSNKKGVQLSEQEVEELQDTESVLSRFRMFYGRAESVFCDRCSKKHIF